MKEPVLEINSAVEKALDNATNAVKHFVSDPEAFRDATGYEMRDQQGQNALVDMAIRATAKFLTMAHEAGSLQKLGVNDPRFVEKVANIATFAAVMGTGYKEEQIPGALFARARSYGLIPSAGKGSFLGG